jgi:multidrug efflux pump
VTDIGSTLETLLGGRAVTNFKRGTKQYDVILQMKPSARATPDAIREIYIRGGGRLVQLANVVRVNETLAPKELNHYNRVRSATLTANVVPGVSLGQALDDLDGIFNAKLSSGLKREFAGQSLEFKSSSTSLYFMFLLAVVFIYLVLAAQFESFVHPLTILLAVPLAVFGALLTLFLFRQTLNIYSQIGLIMLIGLVTKNSILIVEFSNQLRARGKQITDAVIEAATIRLRPILMTSFATIFGVLPIALGLGAGAESRRPLGLAVVGGMFFSTFLTLVLVPVLYTFLAKYTPGHKTATESAAEDMSSSAPVEELVAGGVVHAK